MSIVRVPQDLAAALHVLRIVRGWNASQLAAASGVKNASISDYERAKKTPELATLETLLTAMDYPLSAIDDTRCFIRRIQLAVPPEPETADAEQLAAELGRVVERLARSWRFLSPLSKCWRYSARTGVGTMTRSEPLVRTRM